MPSAAPTSSLAILIVVFVIWFVLKMANVAIRLILFIVIALLVAAGVVYFLS